MGKDAEGNKEGDEDSYDYDDYEEGSEEEKKNATRNLPPFWFVVKKFFLL